MPRTGRITIVDVPHHITQRGNNRQDVFFVDDDRRVYLQILKEQAAKYFLEILGWCLMTNHVHIIACPKTPESLAQALGRTHLSYTQYINRMHNRSGHLWQNRFFSCPLGREHFWKALVYTEQNPVRTRIVRQAWKYKWSSASAHINGRDIAGLLDMPHWKQISSQIDWRKVLEEIQSEETVEQIRLNTHTGRPLASDSFISKMEKVLNRRLRPLPVGRPKKTKKNERSYGNR
jgi:putative transposase